MATIQPKLRFSEFPDTWVSKKLIELSINGFSNGVFNDPKKVGSGYKIINVKDMYSEYYINTNNLTLLDLDEKEFLKNKVIYGDIFFTRSSLVKEGIAHSKVNLSYDDDITYDGHLIRMRPNQLLSNSLFLGYNFSTTTSRKQFILRGKTTTMTTIGQDDIATIDIYLPSLEEQTRIANFLSSVDEKLNLLKEKKALLEDYKKGIMQKIFNQEIRFKDDNSNDFEDWEEKTLGEIGEIITGKTPSTTDSKLWDGDIQFITPTDIKEGNKYQESTVRYVTNNDKLKILPVNSIIYTCIASIGKMCISKYPSITNQQINSLVINKLKSFE
jgi:type I restriction enzyme S subunit